MLHRSPSVSLTEGGAGGLAGLGSAQATMAEGDDGKHGQARFATAFTADELFAAAYYLRTDRPLPKPRKPPPPRRLSFFGGAPKLEAAAPAFSKSGKTGVGRSRSMMFPAAARVDAAATRAKSVGASFDGLAALERESCQAVALDGGTAKAVLESRFGGGNYDDDEDGEDDDRPTFSGIARDSEDTVGNADNAQGSSRRPSRLIVTLDVPLNDNGGMNPLAMESASSADARRRSHPSPVSLVREASKEDSIASLEARVRRLSGDGDDLDARNSPLSPKPLPLSPPALLRASDSSVTSSPSRYVDGHSPDPLLSPSCYTSLGCGTGAVAVLPSSEGSDQVCDQPLRSVTRSPQSAMRHRSASLRSFARPAAAHESGHAGNGAGNGSNSASSSPRAFGVLTGLSALGSMPSMGSMSRASLSPARPALSQQSSLSFGVAGSSRGASESSVDPSDLDPVDGLALEREGSGSTVDGSTARSEAQSEARTSTDLRGSADSPAAAASSRVAWKSCMKSFPNKQLEKFRLMHLEALRRDSAEKKRRAEEWGLQEAARTAAREAEAEQRARTAAAAALLSGVGGAPAIGPGTVVEPGPSLLVEEARPLCPPVTPPRAREATPPPVVVVTTGDDVLAWPCRSDAAEETLAAPVPASVPAPAAGPSEVSLARPRANSELDDASEAGFGRMPPLASDLLASPALLSSPSPSPGRKGASEAPGRLQGAGSAGSFEADDAVSTGGPRLGLRAGASEGNLGSERRNRRRNSYSQGARNAAAQINESHGTMNSAHLLPPNPRQRSLSRLLFQSAFHTS